MDEKKKLIKEFIPILARLTSQLELDSYLRKLAKITDFDIESIRSLVQKYRLNENSATDVVRVMREFRPERKALQKLATAERELLYQMIQNVEAVDFYEENIGAFYDDVYRQIANSIIEYQSEHQNIDPDGVLISLQNSEIENLDEVLDDFMEIRNEDFHVKECGKELLNNLLDTINGEKERINNEDALRDSLKGKSDLEQARIIADYNRRKAK